MQLRISKTSTSATVLADNVNCEENLTMSEIAHYAIGRNNTRIYFSPEIFEKKKNVGTSSFLLICFKMIVI